MGRECEHVPIRALRVNWGQNGSGGREGCNIAINIYVYMTGWRVHVLVSNPVQCRYCVLYTVHS